jgi:hypothetical protein
MTRLLATLAIAAALGAGVGCSEARSARCEQVCQRESTCAEQIDPEDDTVNKSECITKCNELERDSEGASRVAVHVACVTNADDCRAVLACP